MRALSGRETFLVWFGGLACALMIFWATAIRPALEETNRLETAIATARKNHQSLIAMVDEWQQISLDRKAMMGRLASREADFSLAGYLETVIVNSGLSTNLSGLRPLVPEEMPGGASRIMADVKLANASMAALARLLYDIEYSDKMLTITRLSLAAAPNGVDASFRVLTLQATK